ncbi:LytR C-terminal domain-containing protein [Nocardia nova]|uniref:LytR C-terminal domain-containing protein n=1 Tax=Nocardia nova TaxID=37330 RepID=UPI00340B769C
MSNPNPPSGGPPLRALAMVLIALAIVFAGLGAMALSNSTSDSAAAETSDASETSETAASSAAPVTTSAAAPTTEAPATTTTTAPPTTTTSAVDKTIPVRVLNNSTVSGLAAKTGNQLTSAGFDVTETGNYPGGVIAKTTVYYGNSPQEKETAEAIAKELGISAEPRFAGIADSGPGVIVIVTGN